MAAVVPAWVTAFAVAPSLLGQPAEFAYVKKDTREASRAATLAQYRPPLEWSTWYVAGPFDNTGRDKHDVVYPPQITVDLDERYRGKGGATVGWEPIAAAGWDPLDLRRFGSDEANEDAIAYLYREVVADHDLELIVEVGSDDGLKLWFNAKLLIDVDVYRGLDPRDHTISLPVRKGTNRLLAKVTQGVGQWAFALRPRLDPRIEAMLQYRLDLDFPSSPEARHYRMLSIMEPQDVVLEVGGLDVLPDGRPIVVTRRGEVWLIDGAYEDPAFDASFERFAFGLHEPLGALWHDGALYVAQRGELTRIVDLDGDDRADLFETVSAGWGLSGNYHEFAFGPKLDGQGRMWVTLNLGFCGSLGKSTVPWRGWAFTIDGDGAVHPVCGGLRSPNGLGRNAAGDMFYTDNQGDWVGTGKLSHLGVGDWHGHPAGNRWYEDAGMEPPDGEVDFAAPAVWFPYDRMGRSTSDIVLDETEGGFGPFSGQLFVGDQYSASVMRVFLEKVDGVYQGACFPFRSGFDCGVNRMCFAPDGSMFVGMTNRGWWSFGRRPWGLQRLLYTGLVPFEVHEMRAQPGGFELTFTKPVEAATAADVASYAMASFTYHRWEKYGSPEIDRHELAITRAVVGDDQMSVRLTVEGLREGYVHELRLAGVRSREGEPLLHDEAYYTLNVKP